MIELRRFPAAQNPVLEYFQNGNWNEFTLKFSRLLGFNVNHDRISAELYTTKDLAKIVSDSENPIWRITTLYLDYKRNPHAIIQFWYVGDKCHRLDGPAIINADVLGNIDDKYCYWYIDGNVLTDFHEFYLKNNTSERIFGFLNKHPDKVEEIKILAKHNNWLNEEHTLLLESIKFFEKHFKS